jgi:UrcA family protein
MINATSRGLRRPLNLTLAAALAVALACAAAPAAIAQSLNEETVQVSTTGLDTASADGARQLLDRIRMASVKVCATQGDDPVYATGGFFGCVRRTTAHAVARADIPQLTALYRGGNGAVVLAQSR